MQSFFAKTFGGLSKSYYLRHFFFGVLVAASLIAVVVNSPKSNPSFIIFALINTFLYPYSRFVYESVVNFVMGNNVFYGSAIPMLLVKCSTILMCWFFAVFVAPVGLLYLFWRNSKPSVQS
jgi:hypothetical protein